MLEYNMVSLSKIYVTNASNCSIVQFFWSVKLLIAEDAKLEYLKLAILLMIANVFQRKKTRKCMLPEDTKN